MQRSIVVRVVERVRKSYVEPSCEPEERPVQHLYPTELSVERTRSTGLYPTAPVSRPRRGMQQWPQELGFRNWTRMTTKHRQLMDNTFLLKRKKIQENFDLVIVVCVYPLRKSTGEVCWWFLVLMSRHVKQYDMAIFSIEQYPLYVDRVFY